MKNSLKYERGGNLCNDAAVNFLGSERLGARCTQLCLSFALKCQENLRFQDWFALSEVPNTRSDKSNSIFRYKRVMTKTDRYINFLLPYFTNILNEYYSKR